MSTRRISLPLFAALAAASVAGAAASLAPTPGPQSPKASAAGASSTAAGPRPQGSATGLFNPGQTAAAYQVDERIFGRENHVTGRNTAVKVQVESKGDLRRVLLSAPPDKFRTDSGLRDGRVAGLLGGSAHIPVLVRSGWFPASELPAMGLGSHRMAGEVLVRGQAAPVTLTAQGDGKSVRVDVVTSFKGLGLEPPALGPLGILGAVHQALTLSAQIMLDQVQIVK